ncbi:hypothetical protein K458DRAFT_384834 [Lentithecium fluviatile CBS 122367]|uniref:ABC transmembrane type-1 domain-containing protein n=1 Tax=Lentithecium fluviatile CBS 122367 TaxID=1168545 RepID=A0A6G1JET7_9PLEO|nr:hypothetical protein K458DRAFT_384834 [Lentithecium fluviatile CBS 122367]
MRHVLAAQQMGWLRQSPEHPSHTKLQGTIEDHITGNDRPQSTNKAQEYLEEQEDDPTVHSKPTGVYRLYFKAIDKDDVTLSTKAVLTETHVSQLSGRNGGQTRMRVIMASVKVTIEVFTQLLSAALSAPLSFYEKTDTGTTSNRFSQDMQLVDSELPFALLNVFCSGLILIGQLFLIINASYYLAISFLVIFIVLWTLQKIHLRTSRRLQHLELESKTLLYTQFLESPDGLATIRAYSWMQPFKVLNYTRLETSQRPFYLPFCM